VLVLERDLVTGLLVDDDSGWPPSSWFDNSQIIPAAGRKAAIWRWFISQAHR
jgi:hypothetical protein